MKKMLLAIFTTVILMSITATAQAFTVNVGGNWVLNGNGWNSVLTVTQDSETTFHGTLTPLTSPSPGLVILNGTITLLSWGHYAIDFDRCTDDALHSVLQHYSGYVLFDRISNSASSVNGGIAGTFTQTDYPGYIAGWYAQKYSH